MVGLFRMLGRFLNNMDRRAITSLMVMLALLGFVAVMMIFGTDWLGINQDALDRIMVRVSESPFALLGVIAVFCVLALTGFPQTLLIAGTAAVFGAQAGAFNSWIATMCSATLTYSLGHVSGGNFVRRLSAGRAATMIGVVQNRGLLASMVVRVTPSAPFIVINAIFGAARVPIWKYLLGTGVGIIPKILLVTQFTGLVDDLVAFFQSRDPAHLLTIGLVIAGWLAFLTAVRAVFLRLKRGSLSGLDQD